MLTKQISAPELEAPLMKNHSQRANAKVVRFGTNWRAIAAILVVALAALFVVKSILNESTQMKATYVEVDDP